MALRLVSLRVIALGLAPLGLAPSEAHIPQGENLGRVLVELRPVVDDALADGVKVANLALPKVGEQLPQPANVLLLVVAFVVTVAAQLEEHLVIWRAVPG